MLSSHKLHHIAILLSWSVFLIYFCMVDNQTMSWEHHSDCRSDTSSFLKIYKPVFCDTPIFFLNKLLCIVTNSGIHYNQRTLNFLHCFPKSQFNLSWRQRFSFGLIFWTLIISLLACVFLLSVRISIFLHL